METTKGSENDGSQGIYNPSSGVKKVTAVAHAAGIPSVPDRLVELKTYSDESYSLRELEAYFNTRLTKAAFTRSGAEIDLETAGSIYEVISADDPERLTEKKAQTKLDVHDVDVERLQNDFVSHHAIHSYLADVDGVDLSQPAKSGSDQKEELYQRLKKLVGRVSIVTESTLETATSARVLPYDEVPSNVRVTITADCPNCGRSQSVFQLLDYSCSCQQNLSGKSGAEQYTVSADSNS